MLPLTPLEQTRAGRELIELGEIKGREEGLVKGQTDGLHDAIQIVLLTRFPQTSQEMSTRLMAVLSYVHDITTVEILLRLAAQVDSYAAFKQKVLAAVAKSALQESTHGNLSPREESQ